MEYIVRDIREGFRIGFDRHQGRLVSAMSNMFSTHQSPQPVSECLNTELEAGRIVEVGEEVAELVVVSRFGLIPKKEQKGKWRLIQDLSHPEGKCINDGINKELSTLTYVTVDQAVERILQVGRGALLVKVDVKQAYRNSPIHPDDRHLLGMRFEGHTTYMDITLPFGLRSAPKIFTALTDAVEWIVKEKGITGSSTSSMTTCSWGKQGQRSVQGTWPSPFSGTELKGSRATFEATEAGWPDHNLGVPGHRARHAKTCKNSRSGS